MTNTNATNFRQNVFAYLDQVITFNDVLNIATKKGNCVVLSDEEYRGIMETLYLYSIPGMVDKLLTAAAEPVEAGTPAEEIDW